MLFQTLPFLVLMACVMLVVTLNRRGTGQHRMLLLASYVFYGWWDVRFCMLILLSTVIDFAAGLGMDGVKLSWPRRLKLSGLMIAATGAFLVVNWPAVQRADTSDWSALLGPTWSGGWWAILACALFALAGPALYGLYFRVPEKARRRAFLITSIVANLGILGFFKYFNFFADSLTGLGSLAGLQLTHPALKVALPVGISFYTFQTMSYTIDAYRGVIAAERSFVRMALYVAYFPQLVAGPILRPGQFLPAMRAPWTITGANLMSGANLFAVGLFKKVLIADNVAPMVDTIFSNPSGRPSLSIMLGALLFAVQIYSDFSGYTDMARGVSRVFGVEIPLNFDFPYFATSIIDFWRRWHISLSTWLRDYLYIPLGGSRGGAGRTYFNLMATMVLGGLWHGASWNFVIWGAYQGALLCLNRVLRALVDRHAGLSRLCASRVGAVVRWSATMYLVLLGWLIFRVTDFDHLRECLRSFVFFDANFSLGALGLGRGDPATAGLAVLVFGVAHAGGFFSGRWSDRFDRWPTLALLALYAGLGLVFFLFWPTGRVPFIYFQF